MAKITMSATYISAAIILVAAFISAQEYGQRIGRRNRQNIGFGSVSSPDTQITSETNVPVASRTMRINSGYSYVPPTNPLLLPSSSNQEDYQVNFAIAFQPSEAVQHQIEQDPAPLEIQEIQPGESFPAILADQNSLAPAQQQQQLIDEEIAFWDFRESIPGEPEFDYPILDKIPTTSFKCTGQKDGYYADVETRCQVFHVCTNVPDADPIKASFLCPNGTIFNQEVFVCQWWPDVNCASSPQFFELNRNIGIVPESSRQRDALKGRITSNHV
ncbi:uncharacterized protein LOC116917843 [Daphnia magna]|uniref:uncharacterized protein LOC116917843 n=1 Tax=Daphnia magna TaxID=35525 RepID=UPI001E1BB1C3|nr:uncharacterized protein LOC116917843 [Daphnia magna]XP_045024887.1 uncharacterized protein LOC116917843 [Daphnia magna]